MIAFAEELGCYDDWKCIDLGFAKIYSFYILGPSPYDEFELEVRDHWLYMNFRGFPKVDKILHGSELSLDGSEIRVSMNAKW